MSFIGALIVLLIILALWNRIFVTVPTGSVGVLWLRFFGGTVTDFHFSEGTKLIFPWDRIFLYNARLQRVDVTINAMSEEGLPILIKGSASIQIIPDRVGVLNEDVGPDYQTIMLEPAIQAAVRERVAAEAVADLASVSRVHVEADLLRVIQAKWSAIRDALTGTTAPLIRIYEFNIREIDLPAPFTAAVEDKLAEAQSTQGYQYVLARARLEAQRRIIEAESIRRFQEIVTPTITEGLLRWRGIEATLALAQSQNAKVVVIGGGASGLPLILDTKSDGTATTAPTAPSTTGAAAGDTTGMPSETKLPGSPAAAREPGTASESMPTQSQTNSDTSLGSFMSVTP